jgi:D-alanyl-D-alanine carboxypeptidase (penicillin-binding protein 5/6)
LIAAVVLLVAVLAPPARADEPDVSASGAVLWDPADDRVLWGHDQHQELSPASTTKVMTVLLALEAGSIDEEVTVSSAAVAAASSPDAATLNLYTGQTISMRSLLAGLILRSGNDAAVAVAEHVAGSEDAFVQKMNARAAELGLRDTNFINASGLTDDPEHHTSALDLARLAEVALRNDDFAAWAGADTLDVDGLGLLANRNALLTSYQGATGVKTGYTSLAGLCLVASASREGRDLIAVVLGSAGGLGGFGHFSDSAEILDHGFEDYRRAQPLRRRDPALVYRWSGGEVDLVAAQGLGRTVPAERNAAWRVQLEPAPALPVDRGDVLGTAELVLQGTVVDQTELTARRTVPAPQPALGVAGAGAAIEDAIRAFARLHVARRAA